MATCRTCAYLRKCIEKATKEGYEHNVDFDPKDGCTGIGFKSNTNADRIRAMSDEELADNWMRDFVVCHRCAYRYECECDEYVTYEKCKEGIVEWLKQPAEEVKDA